jgi:NADPH:quinone reductase-like Zn-dependent oxidoreductase
MMSHVHPVTTMKAAVLYGPGGPEALKVKSRPIPPPELGDVLIKVMVAGMNRSELFTRQGKMDTDRSTRTQN